MRHIPASVALESQPPNRASFQEIDIDMPSEDNQTDTNNEESPDKKFEVKDAGKLNLSSDYE